MRKVLLVAFVLVTAVSRLDAAPARRAVLMMHTVPLDDTKPLDNRDLFDAAALAMRDRPALSVVSDEERFVVAPELTPTPFLACGRTLDCHRQLIAPYGFQVVILTMVNAKADPPLVIARLIDTERGAVSESFAEATSLEVKTLRTLLRQSVERVLDDAGYLRVVAPPPVAIVSPAQNDSIITSPWLWGSVAVAVAATVTTLLLVSGGDDARCVCFSPTGFGCDPC